MQRKFMKKKSLAFVLAASLCVGSVSPAAAAPETNEKGAKAEESVMLAHYPLQGDVQDVSGNGNHAAIHGNVSWTDGLVLPGGTRTDASNASYVTLPEGMFDGEDEVTISVWINSNTDAGNYSALFFGTETQNNHLPLNYWLFNPTNPSGMFKSVFTNSDNSGSPWSTEVGVTSASTVEYKGVWTHYTTVLTEDSVTGYINGNKIGSAQKTKTTSDFGENLQAYIGRSNYTQDNTYGGSFQDLRIYDQAMTEEEVEEVYLDTSSVNDNVKAKVLEGIAGRLNLNEILDEGYVAKDGMLNLPKELFGASIDWSSDQKDIISDEGNVTLPEQTTTVTLTARLTLGAHTATKAFQVPVLARDGQIDFWMEQIAIPYVLSQGDMLPVSLGNVEISWTGDDAVKEDGSIVPAFTGKKQVTLTATLTEGQQSQEKQFEAYILGEDAMYVESYTRASDADYSNNLAYSMHLAYSQDGNTGFHPLNDNSGLLFMRATENADQTLNRKGLKNPYLFYTKEGSFGVAATRVEVDGSTDDQAASSVAFWTSDNLRAYQEVSLVDLKTEHTVNDPVCEYDSGADVYRITWKDENGNYYQNTMRDLADAQSVSEPVSALAPSVRRVETEIPGAAEGNVLPLENGVGTKLKTKLSKLVNTGMEVPEQITAASEAEVEAVRATALYNDGSTASKQVDWDLREVDFTEPGLYTVKGTVTQPTFQNDQPLFAARPDPEMTKYNGKFYFISTDENGQSRIYIRQSDTLASIGQSVESLILDGGSYPDLFVNCLWAPELHVIGDDLYVFFAGSLSGWSGVQSYVMKLKEGGDPTQKSDWERPIRVVDQNGNNLYETSSGITLDMTYFEVAGQAYVVWAQRQIHPVDTGSRLYIATVDQEKPWQLTSDRVCISKPDYGWDNNDTFVDEGPFLIQRNGKLYLTFSGGMVNPTYCVGILTANEGDNLLDASVWTKGNYPILTSRSVENQYGPGHNSYIYDDDGTLYNVYHAQWNKGTRSAGIRRVHFDIDGDPILDLVEERDLVDAYKDVSMKVLVPGEVTVTYIAGEGGRIEGTAVQNIGVGESTTAVTAVADPGYEFAGWSDGKTEAVRSDSNVLRDASYQAMFRKAAQPAQKVTVTYHAGVGGRIAGTTVQTIDKGGSTTEVAAVADAGYTFSKWSDGVTSPKRTDANVTESKTVTAEFTKNPSTEPETPEASGVKLNVKKKIAIGVREKVKLKATVLPAGASQKVTWKSSKKSVVSVSADGKITGKKRGTAIITATTENGKKTTCRVTVKKAPKKITTKVTAKTLKKGKTWKMKVSFPGKAASYQVTFRSNKKKVATVSANGKIKARKKGTAVITARAYNGKKVKVKITVK